MLWKVVNKEIKRDSNENIELIFISIFIIKVELIVTFLVNSQPLDHQLVYLPRILDLLTTKPFMQLTYQPLLPNLLDQIESPFEF